MHGKGEKGMTTTQPLTTSQLSDKLDALNDDMSGKELGMYTYAANASFNQTMASTLGELSVEAAKSKPQEL
jgi:hypothetical protein